MRWPSPSSPSAAATTKFLRHYLRRSSTIPNEIHTLEEIATILTTIPFSHPSEPHLKLLSPLLTPHIISQTLPLLPKPSHAFRLFVFASQFRKLRSWHSHNHIISLLRSHPDAFPQSWRFLHKLKKLTVTEKGNFGLTIPPPAFTVLISAYSLVNLPEKAVETFQLMPEYNCRPNTFTYNTVLKILVDKCLVMLAMAVYNRMVKLDCRPDCSTYTILMHGLCTAGKFDDAIELFDEMTERNVSPNLLVSTVFLGALCKANKLEEGIELLYSMGRVCKVDSVMRNALLSGVCRAGKVDEAFRHLRVFEKDGFVLDLCGYSCLIDGLFRVGKFEDACGLYEEMLEKGSVKPDCIFFTIMIKGFVEAGRVEEAFSFLDTMRVRGLVPDTFCYNTLIKGLCDRGLLDEARPLFLEISQNGLFPDSATYCIMICGLCKKGLLDEAQDIFAEMGKLGCGPTVMTFNALLDGLCKSGKLREAHIHFCKMEMGENPSLFLRLSQGSKRVDDSNSLRLLVEELCQSGQVLKAYKLMCDIINCGVVPDVVTYNILINCLCKTRNIDGALKLFKEIQLKGHFPDAVTYGTLIDGLVKVHRNEDAMMVFQHMIRSGCSPSLSIYSILMRTLCREKKVAQAVMLWLNYLSQERALPEEAETVTSARKEFEQGDVEGMIRLLIEMDKKQGSASAFPYTIWLIGFCQAQNVDEALTIFMILRESNIDATLASCALLINCLCRQRKLPSAMDVMLYALNKGFDFREPVGNRLLKTLCMQNKKDAAQELVRRMHLDGYDVDNYLRVATKHLLYS